MMSSSDRDAQRKDDAACGPTRSSPVPAGLPRIVDSRALLGGGPLAIRHGDAIYYLRATRFGKLILTK